MESAFGIDHGDVSKGLSAGKAAGLFRASKQGGNRGKYAGARLAAHRSGQQGQKAVGQNNRDVARFYQGRKQELAVKNPRKPGYQGSRSSRINRST